MNPIPVEENSMARSNCWTSVGTTLFVLALFANLSAAPAKKQTFTGEVGDAMCGRKHMVDQGTPTQCTRACVSHGSKYALVVGDRVYVLDASDKAALDTLDKQAGKNATVTGVLNGDTIEVSSVAAR